MGVERIHSMTKYRITLEDCRPFSINDYRYKNGGVTQRCMAWRRDIFSAFPTTKNLESVRSFKQKFDPLKHGIRVAISHEIPHEYFFTKAGEISLRSKDLSNVEKLPIDLLFDKKFNDRGDIENLCLNDKHIVHLISEKIPGQTWKIVIELSIIDMEDYKCLE